MILILLANDAREYSCVCTFPKQLSLIEKQRIVPNMRFPSWSQIVFTGDSIMLTLEMWAGMEQPI